MGKQKTQPMIGEKAYEDALNKKSRTQKFREFFTETKTKKIMERNASIAYLEFQLEKCEKKNDVLLSENLELRAEKEKLQELYSDMCRSLAQNQLKLDEAAERVKSIEEQNEKKDTQMVRELQAELQERSQSVEDVNSELLRQAAESQKMQEDAATRMALMQEQTADLLRQIQEVESMNKKIPQIEQNQSKLQTQVKQLEEQVNHWTLYARALWKPKAREALTLVSDDLALCDICHSEIEVREKRATQQQVDAVANPLTSWFNTVESWDRQAMNKRDRQWAEDFKALKAAQEELEEMKEILVDLQQYKDTVLRQNREILQLKDTIETQATDLKTTGVFVSQLQALLETSQKENVDLQEKVCMTRRALE